MLESWDLAQKSWEVCPNIFVIVWPSTMSDHTLSYIKVFSRTIGLHRQFCVDTWCGIPDQKLCQGHVSLYQTLPPFDFSPDHHKPWECYTTWFWGLRSWLYLIPLSRPWTCPGHLHSPCCRAGGQEYFFAKVQRAPIFFMPPIKSLIWNFTKMLSASVSSNSTLWNFLLSTS